MDNVRPRGSCSPIKRSYYTKPALRPKDLKQDVKTFGVKNMNTAGKRAVVNTGKGKLNTDLKKSRWVWRPKGNYLDHVSKDSGSFMLKKGNLEILLQDHAVVDSSCSSHMTGNKAYLSDYEDYNGGFVAFGNKLNFKLLDKSQVVLKAPRKDDVYSLDLKNIVPFGGVLKLYDMNELLLRNGIKRSFSVARTPQQKEAVNTACYVLNRVLVTKPQNKTPYELLIGKFDGKSDEGYLLGYSTFSKAFRVYNKRTKRVEENLHINFLEDQLNVEGTSPNWIFDLDFLTNSMNYIPVSVENHVDVDAGTQDSYVAGSSGKDKGPTQEYIPLLLQPHRIRIPIEDVASVAHETPSESSPKDVQDLEDVTNKESKQDLQDELEKMVTQELAAKAMDDVSRQDFEEEKRRIASQKKAAQATSTNKLSTDRPYVSTNRPSVSTDRPSVSTDRPSVSTDRPLVSTDRSNTPYVSAASTSTSANAGESSFVYLGGKIHIDASTLPNVDLPIDPNMPDLEDASDTLPNDRIFNGAYDEDVGAVADFNNMDNTIAVSPIPTLRIHKVHPKGQILGDPTSAVQTRGKIQKASSAQQALKAENDTPLPIITTMKIPIIRKGEYDIWIIRMRQYISHTDHKLWDVIVNGDLEEEPAPTSGETSVPPAPKTTK
ncbi:ribonuclease H-like domain-containing protein, partial [Tanacetum coccineum]